MDKEGKYKLRQIEAEVEGEFIMSPKNDFAFKLIFGDERDKDILISFLSAVMRIKEEKFEGLELVNTELIKEFSRGQKGYTRYKS